MIGITSVAGGLITVASIIHEAEYESGRRAGTENIILEVGLGKACEISVETLDTVD